MCMDFITSAQSSKKIAHPLYRSVCTNWCLCVWTKILPRNHLKKSQNQSQGTGVRTGVFANGQKYFRAII